MLQKIVMPKLGGTMEEGSIVSWLVKEGDSIRKGDIIMRVESDKATLDVEALAEGKLLKIVVPEDRKVPIGSVVAWLGSEEDELPASEPEPLDVEGVSTGQLSAGTTTDETAFSISNHTASRQRISPRAIKLARRLGIQPADIGTGSGPMGRITSGDVQDFYNRRVAQRQQTEAAKGRVIQPDRLRKLTAERMVESWKTIPCFDLVIEVRMDRLLDRIESHSSAGGRKIAIHDALIMATVEALREYSVLTGQWTEEGIVIPERFGIGLAVALEEGLIAPVIQEADLESLMRIANRTTDLIARAKSGKLGPDDLSGACLTISNLGMMDIEMVSPIIIPGQSSIIGVGKIKETPVVERGEIAAAKVMKLTLSVDHRLTDGAYAAEFLNSIRNRLEHPGQMFD
jgi:pyruvate dehydrogenase E2 component (dihydrolipoamide acetyltransferase)